MIVLKIVGTLRLLRRFELVLANELRNYSSVYTHTHTHTQSGLAHIVAKLFDSVGLLYVCTYLDVSVMHLTMRRTFKLKIPLLRNVKSSNRCRHWRVTGGKLQRRDITCVE